MLTPVDIETKEFKRAKIGGYHPDDVNDFLDDVIRSYEELYRENIELKDKITLLNENIQYYKSMESTLQNALVLAEKTAQDTKELAYQKSEQIISEGIQKADTLIQNARHEVTTMNQKIEELHKQYKSAKIQIKQMLEIQLEILESQDVFEKKSDNKEKDKDYYTKEYQIVMEEDAV